MSVNVRALVVKFGMQLSIYQMQIMYFLYTMS